MKSGEMQLTNTCMAKNLEMRQEFYGNYDTLNDILDTDVQISKYKKYGKTESRPKG